MERIKNLDDVNLEIALHIPYEELKYYCLTSKFYYSICSNEFFWKKRIEHEFPDAIRFIHLYENITFKEFYEALINNHMNLIPVTFNGEYIDVILTDVFESEFDVFKRAADFILSLYPDIDQNTTIIIPYYITNRGISPDRQPSYINSIHAFGSFGHKYNKYKTYTIGIYEKGFYPDEVKNMYRLRIDL